MSTWQYFFDGQKSQPYYSDLEKFIKIKRRTHGKCVIPSIDLAFEAFRYKYPEDVKVVILGEDPNALCPPKGSGLTFSLPKSVPADGVEDRAIWTIIEALKTDGVPFKHNRYGLHSGCLEEWAEQGVLLLNLVMIYRREETTIENAHEIEGWKIFTENVIKFLSTNYKNLVFMLWGSKATSFITSIENRDDHLVLEGPDPAACGHNNPEFLEIFKGCHFFSTANNYLTQNGRTPINWQLLHL